MKLHVIRQESELQKLRSSWEELLNDCASDTIFLTWEWATAWWSAYGQQGCLRVVTAVDEGGAIRGIAPLRIQTVRRYGQTVEALTFVGDNSNDSDYLDFIIAAGYEEQVMAKFGGYLAEELRDGRLLLLNEIPEASPNLTFLKRLVERQPGVISTEESVPCGTVRLPQEWEGYLKGLRPRFRTKVRSVLRNLEDRKEVRFGFCESVEQLERTLPVLFDLHSRRWALEGKPGVFGQPHKREFYLSLSKLLLERGWLRFSLLEWQGTVLACQYGFRYRDTYYQLQEGYEPASDHWNLGIGLRAWSIREFLREKITEYDFMGGVGRHKADWGAEIKQSKQIVIAADSYRNRLFCFGPGWEAQARDSVKKVLPEKILAACRTQLEPQNKEAVQSGSAEWMLKAAAGCYSHLGLATLTRPLRARYQLSLATNGTRPGILVKRRSAPSGRILYYHRINDEHDPFFPAMSTGLFEQQMRFLAKHYRVVSLASLIEHLESDSPETQVAVTIDDGYQDNYRNAFPILQQYGLPATIFLTTGSIDSGEPLWFERLAEGVQKTSRESMDLEIDVPRRFWMRTLAERLEANGRIFSLLRGLKNSERLRWLDHILGELAVPVCSLRKSGMLDWDQVREMSASRIDFGGHTVTHPFLSQMSREGAAWEVSECKRRIEQELQNPAHFFSYPNGRAEDFAPWNKDLLRQAGYRAAATTIWGVNSSSTDAMELRRGGPWEETAALFALKLDWYQLVNG